MRIDPFDLGPLFALREVIGSVGRGGLPELAPVTAVPSARTIALLPGSFNPPTAAHLLLAERALSEGFDRVVYTYARGTLGKRPNGLIPEDRLLVLRAAASDPSGTVAVCSHGLYADQAEAAAALFPGAELAFLVGSDKVIQIFEERWYPDRDAALDRLFDRARLVVAPRADQGERLRGILRSPGNARYSDRVDILRLHPAVSDLSSTRVRGLLRAGADPAGVLPATVSDMLADMSAFAAPAIVDGYEVDAYQIRVRLIELIWRERGSAAAGLNLRALWRTTLEASETGRTLRALIADDAIEMDALLAAASG